MNAGELVGGDAIARITPTSLQVLSSSSWDVLHETAVSGAHVLSASLDAQQYAVLHTADGDTLVHSDEFEVDRWSLGGKRRLTEAGECAIVCAVDGIVSVAGLRLSPGHFALVPANAADPVLHPSGAATVQCAIASPAARWLLPPVSARHWCRPN